MAKDIKDLIKTLENIQKNVDKASENLVDKIADDVIESAKRKTVGGNGKMKEGWTSKDTPNGKEVYNKEEYTVYEEFGHRTQDGKFHRGKHILRDSKNEARSKLPERSKEFWDEVKR